MKTSYLEAIALYEAWIAAGNPADLCQCCGARLPEGLKGCFELFAELPWRPFAIGAPGSASTYGVDAHALQHPEIHGKKNNAAHLLRLCWVFEGGGDAMLSGGPAWWQHYLDREPVPHLPPPERRGEVTVADVAAASDAADYVRLTERWARSVYAAWAAHHPWARQTLQRIAPR